MRLPLPVHSYRTTSPTIGTQRLVNCFAEAQPPEGKSPSAIRRTPGIASFAAPTAGTGRGLFNWNETLFAVVGSTLYSVSSAGALTSLGSITGDNICTFAPNTSELVVCPGPDAFVWNGTTLTQITDTDYTSRGAGMCAALDSYILFNEPNSGRFFSSTLNNAQDYDPLYFATAEGFPDYIVGLVTDHRQVILAGTRTLELWYDAGGSGFPFARDSNGFIEIGCAAGKSLAKVDNSVFWVADDLTVRRLNGLTPVRVSQHGVEQAIRTYTISDAYAFTYAQEGHLFYVLTFPTDAKTWVFDVTTNEWHERESYNSTRWRACSAVSCYGRVFVQDFETGAIGYLDPDTNTEFGEILRASWTFGMAAYTGNSRTFHKNLEAIVESGVGLTTGQGSDPEIMLDLSDDGGHTWRSMPNKKLGAIGTYRTRVRWERLGSSRERIYRMAVSDPVKVTVSDCMLEVA